MNTPSDVAVRWGWLPPWADDVVAEVFAEVDKEFEEVHRPMAEAIADALNKQLFRAFVEAYEA